MFRIKKQTKKLMNSNKDKKIRRRRRCYKDNHKGNSIVDNTKYDNKNEQWLCFRYEYTYFVGIKNNSKQ